MDQEMWSGRRLYRTSASSLFLNSGGLPSPFHATLRLLQTWDPGGYKVSVAGCDLGPVTGAGQAAGGHAREAASRAEVHMAFPTLPFLLCAEVPQAGLWGVTFRETVSSMQM